MKGRSFFLTALLLALPGLVASPADEALVPPGEGDARIPEIQATIAARGWHWTAGHTSVSNLSDAQQQVRLGLLPPPVAPEAWGAGPAPSLTPLPSLWDWREMNGVTPVKNQGNCGSCWDFAGVAACESMIRIYSGVVRDLSEQQVLSCNTYGYGCDGGWMVAPYRLFRDYGAVEESCMPYEADDTVPCTQAACTVVETIDGWSGVSQNVNALKTALQTGPVACAMYVYNDFFYYDNGCYEHGTTSSVNHAVLLVGWDDSECGGSGAWIIKNSWGVGWGIDGYGYIKFGDSNIGSYADLVSYTGTMDPPGEPVNPAPADGADGVPLEIDLCWDAASGAATYDLFFGTAPDPAELAGDLSTTCYAGLPTLEFDTTYYWRVVAVNAAGETSSAEWSFTTQPAPPPPEPEQIVTGPGPGDHNAPLVRVFAAGSGGSFSSEFSAYTVDRYGVNTACGDIDGDGTDEILTGPGPGSIFGPQVRGFEWSGSPVGGGAVNFMAYGTFRWGVNVACGDIDGDGFAEILSGAGPGEVFGPHVRGFNYDGATLGAIPQVSFIAYSTHKWGVNVACGDIDGDGFDEILTGAGPGSVFGPHVRGFNYDGAALAAIPRVSFLAYGTNQYGVRVACGDIDGDGIDELLTSPGPGTVFGPHVRGWNYDGATLAAIGAVSFMAYDYTQLGANVGAADIDGDGFDEILTGPGPGPAFLPRVRVWNYDGTAPVTLVEEFDAYDAGTTGFGVKVSGGKF